MREISVRVAVWGDALVDLHDMHALPRKVLVGQRPQHLPGRAPAADGHDKPAAGGDRCPCPPRPVTARACAGDRSRRR